MNWSLEITRAISGGIGIVLTIPITITLMSLLLNCEVSHHECNYIIRIYLIFINDCFWRD